MGQLEFGYPKIKMPVVSELNPKSWTPTFGVFHDQIHRAVQARGCPRLSGRWFRWVAGCGATPWTTKSLHGKEVGASLSASWRCRPEQEAEPVQRRVQAVSAPAQVGQSTLNNPGCGSVRHSSPCRCRYLGTRIQRRRHWGIGLASERKTQVDGDINTKAR